MEHLLSALEMLGVDNARIEIEGGHEVPIIDGSALGWAIDCQAVRVLFSSFARQPSQLVFRIHDIGSGHGSCLITSTSAWPAQNVTSSVLQQAAAKISCTPVSRRACARRCSRGRRTA